MSRNNEPEDLDKALSTVSYSYSSNITPRAATIKRRTVDPNRLTSVYQTLTNYSSNSNQNQQSNSVPLKPKSNTVVAITEKRETEKKELGRLNDKFASYVERVRFLEVHNKKLQMELDALTSRAGNEAGKIREMYEVELKVAQSLIDDTGKGKENTALKARIGIDELERSKKKYQDALENKAASKAKIDDLNRQICSNESEINLLKRRLADLEDEAKRYKLEAQKIIAEIQRITTDLDSETLLRLQLENEKNVLEEELSFLRQMHAQELEEMRRKSFVDVGLDSTQFFKSELAQAIKQIRNEYETINNNQRQDMEQWYRTKLQEVQSRERPEAADVLIAKEETKKLKSNVSDLRKDNLYIKSRNAELEARIKEMEELLSGERNDGQAMIEEKELEILELNRRRMNLQSDYDELTKMKISLEEEIKTYRKLLEGEEDYGGLKQVVEGIEERVARQQLNSVSMRDGTTKYSFSVQSSTGGSRYPSTSSVSNNTRSKYYY